MVNSKMMRIGNAVPSLCLSTVQLLVTLQQNGFGGILIYRHRSVNSTIQKIKVYSPLKIFLSN